MELFEDELVDWFRSGEPGAVRTSWDNGCLAAFTSELGRALTVLNGRRRSQPIMLLSESFSFPLTAPANPCKGLSSSFGRMVIGDNPGLETGLNLSSRTADRDVRRTVSPRKGVCPIVDGRVREPLKNAEGVLRGDLPEYSGGCVGGVIGRVRTSGTGGSLRPGGNDGGVETGDSAGCQSCGGSGCGTDCTTGSGLGGLSPRPEKSMSKA